MKDRLPEISRGLALAGGIALLGSGCTAPSENKSSQIVETVVGDPGQSNTEPIYHNRVQTTEFVQYEKNGFSNAKVGFTCYSDSEPAITSNSEETIVDFYGEINCEDRSVEDEYLERLDDLNLISGETYNDLLIVVSGYNISTYKQ